LTSLGIGHFINPSIHRGVLRQAQLVNRFNGFPVSLPTSHRSKRSLLFTVEKPLKRLFGLHLLQPLDKSTS
jgi:hypothetical protein